MDPWKLFTLKLVIFLVSITFGGFVLLRFVDFIEDAWKTKNRKKKWIAMSTVVGIYLALKGWFL